MQDNLIYLGVIPYLIFPLPYNIIHMYFKKCGCIWTLFPISLILSTISPISIFFFCTAIFVSTIGHKFCASVVEIICQPYVPEIISDNFIESFLIIQESN